MLRMTQNDICEAVQGYFLQNGDPDLVVDVLSTDSRQIPPRCLFVPLSGERFDGHDFLLSAAEKGAAVVLTHQKSLPAGFPPSVPAIQVVDTKVALGDLARAKRLSYPDLLSVAITGSVGKTSTKEMTAHVLAYGRKVQKTPLNYNNEIGLPMTILSMDDSGEASGEVAGNTSDETVSCLVLEMGMRGFGQISYLSHIALPDIGIITNIGSSHLELLGSREGIFQAKLELCSGLSDSGTLLLNGEDAFLSRREVVEEEAKRYGKHPRILYFGFGESCDIRASQWEEADTGSRFLLQSPWGEVSVCLRVPGEHAVRNALAAAGAGLLAGMPLADISQALASYGDEPLRQQISPLENLTLLDDTYNASPESMRATLSVLEKLGPGRKVAILGDMFELGEEEMDFHRQVGAFAREHGVTCLIATGTLARYYGEGFEGAVDTVDTDSADYPVCYYVANAEEAAACYTRLHRKGDCVLVKGSHGMHMEKTVASIREDIR